MEKIYQHIEKLLAQHDYVVVPNFGGFVIQKQSAVLFADHITPPLVTVGFNPLMHFSDGLLAIEIAKTDGISYREAIEIIEKEVDNIKTLLKKNTVFEFGNLGFINTNKEGSILFSPKQKADFLPLNFGISDIYITEIAKHHNNSQKKITLTLPSNQLFKYAAAGILIFGLLFITPSVNDMKVTNQADLSSLIPVKIPKSFSEQDSVVNNDSTLNSDATIITQKAITNNDSLKFHVIVASLPTQIAAENYCKVLENEKFAQAHVLPPAKTYRVAIQSFSKREIAIEYMENLRLSEPQFETAWVFCN